MTNSPVDYKEAAVLAHEAGEDLLSRLEWMTLQPRVIVDAGCGPGGMIARLQSRYKEARVLAVDLSEHMLSFAKTQVAGADYLCADAARLPLRDQSVDLIAANFLLPWHDDVALLLREWRRVLRENGLVLFTALGPDTMKAQQVLFQRHDMHDLGDLMLAMGFSDPVLDVDTYTLSYRDKTKCCQELAASGMMAAGLESDGLEAAFEVVFAHAFQPVETSEVSASSDGIVRIPLSHLRRRVGAGD